MAFVSLSPSLSSSSSSPPALTMFSSSTIQFSPTCRLGSLAPPPFLALRRPTAAARARRKSHVVCMAPDEEKMTRRSPLDFPIEWERPKPGRRPDIFPQFSPMKTPLPPPLPADPPEEDEEEEEKKEEEEEEQEENPDKPDGQ